MDKSQWLQGLLRDNEGRLFRYIKRWVSEETARDLVQETFLRLWRQDQQQLVGREAEWLFCVCRNLALDVLKKEKAMGHSKNDSGDPLEMRVASDNQTAEAAMASRQVESEVLRMVGKLPTNQQEVLRLKFQEGFS